MRLKQDVSERVSERVLHFAATVVVVLIAAVAAAAAAHDVGAAVVVAFEISAHILRRLT